MKQLTKEQQEEMLQFIEYLSKEDAFINKDYYIDKAKAFLQSLKPKIYVCQLFGIGEIRFWKGAHISGALWVSEIEDAKSYSLEGAQLLKEELSNSYDNIFILTE